MTARTQPAPAETGESNGQAGMKEAVANGSPLHLVGEVQRRWRDTAYLSLHRLRVSPSDGCLVLSGTVPSFFIKQVAQEIAMRAVASVVVQNEIEVDDRAQPRALKAPRRGEARLKRGDRVRVIDGALGGAQGVVVKRHRKCRVVVALTLAQQGVSVEIDDYLLERI